MTEYCQKLRSPRPSTRTNGGVANIARGSSACWRLAEPTHVDRRRTLTRDQSKRKRIASRNVTRYFTTLTVRDIRYASLWSMTMRTDSAESLTILLSLAGHETQTAFDGLEAMEAAATFKPDVILLDIGLPKLNGYEVARKIREQPWGQTMVLVALTGWGQEEDRRRSREAGFNHHLTKPVDPLDLTRLLARLSLAQSAS